MSLLVGGKTMFKTTLKKKSTINIIPMIDVIFFLLVFFMLFTTFKSSPTGIDLQLPRAVTVSQQDSENFIIDLDNNGRLYYQGNQISLSNLTQIANNKYQENGANNRTKENIQTTIEKFS